MIKPINNFYILDIELKKPPYNKKAFQTSLYNREGLEVVANKDFNANVYNNQTGIVVAAPAVIEDDIMQIEMDELFINDIDVEVGDKVWFHHLATDKVNRMTIGDKLYFRQKYEMIYAVEQDGKLYPTERNIFIRPTYESPAEMMSKYGIVLKMAPGKVASVGVVVAASNYCQSLGIKSGTTVLYSRYAEYQVAYMEPTTYVCDAYCIFGILNN